MLNNLKMSSQGFTFIELLVTIAISGLLLGMGVAAYNNFSDHQKLLLTVRSLKTNLRAAQAKAMGNKIPSDCTNLEGYLVTFTADDYSIAASCNPEGDVGTETYTLPSGIELTTSSGPLLFKPLTAGPELAGDLVLTYLRQGTTDEAAITITPGGEIK